MTWWEIALLVVGSVLFLAALLVLIAVGIALTIGRGPRH